jgi:predicted RNase H-like nuclease (RuvC/YqgF family)
LYCHLRKFFVDLSFEI